MNATESFMNENETPNEMCSLRVDLCGYIYNSVSEQKFDRILIYFAYIRFWERKFAVSSSFAHFLSAALFLWYHSFPTYIYLLSTQCLKRT